MLNSKLILILFLSFFSCASIEKCKDNKACEEFERNLSIIKNSLELEKIFDGEELEKSRFFMEKITSIESEEELGLEGAYPPSEEDYKKWKDWLKKNKLRLYWDTNDSSVKVKSNAKSD